jgi:hypothetical protein
LYGINEGREGDTKEEGRRKEKVNLYIQKSKFVHSLPIARFGFIIKTRFS